MQNSQEIVPWTVVFSVLAAIMFCSSSMATFFSSKSKKRRALTPDDVEPLSIQDEEEEEAWKPEETVTRTLWMPRETQRPVDYMYSASRLTR
jgi:hypothetical protein